MFDAPQKQPFSEVKEKIFHKLGVSEKEFEKVSWGFSRRIDSSFNSCDLQLMYFLFQYKFAFVAGGKLKNYLENDTLLDANAFRPIGAASKS